MTGAPLLRAWLTLLLLSAASTAFAFVIGSGVLHPGTRLMAGAALLVLARAKAGIILAHYLRLVEAPSLRRGFGIVLTLYMALLLALYLSPGLR